MNDNELIEMSSTGKNITNETSIDDMEMIADRFHQTSVVSNDESNFSDDRKKEIQERKKNGPPMKAVNWYKKGKSNSDPNKFSILTNGRTMRNNEYGKKKYEAAIYGHTREEREWRKATKISEIVINVIIWLKERQGKVFM